MDAIDWAIENKARYGIRVLNVSLGHPAIEPAADDPLVQAVERAVQAGLVVVCSAGNLGKHPVTGQPIIGAISSPGNSPSVITVGALNTRARRSARTTKWPATARAGRPTATAS